MKRIKRFSWRVKKYLFLMNTIFFCGMFITYFVYARIVD